MSITSANELTRDNMPDLPDANWPDTWLEFQNAFNRQTLSSLSQIMPFVDCSTSALKTFDLTHATALTIQNPLNVPIAGIYPVACIGRTVDSTGAPTRAAYNLPMPTIEWHNSTAGNGSVVITAYYPGPISGPGSQGETLSINRLRSNGLAMTSGSVTNVGTTASLILTAGSWKLTPTIGVQLGATTSISVLTIAVNNASAVLPGTDRIAGPLNGLVWMQDAKAANVPVNDQTIGVPTYDVIVADGTTLQLWLLASATFTVSTCQCYGSLIAIRTMPYRTGTIGRVGLLFVGGG